MNEEELKNLWQADNAAPTIDFAAFQKSLTAWQNKLRRKVRIDVWAQGITAGLSLFSVFFYPRLIFADVLLVILTVWYIRELRELRSLETGEADYAAVKYSLNAKIKTMKNYFRRTRIAMYVFTPLIIPALFYGLGYLDRFSVTFAGWIFLLFTYEILIVIATEIYFAIIYTRALNELKNLLRQLNSDE